MRTPRLRTVFVSVALSILLLPLGGVVLLRLYESVLVRRTEASLIAQGAVLAAVHAEEMDRMLGEAVLLTGRGQHAGEVAVGQSGEGDGNLRPVFPRLNLAVDPIKPRPEPARPAAKPADVFAVEAGRRLGPALARVQAVTLAGIRVVSSEGIVVATTRTELGMSLMDREEVAGALAGKPVSLMRRRVVSNDDGPPGPFSRNTALRVFVALPVFRGDQVVGAVVLSRTPQSVTSSLMNIRPHVVGGLVVLLTLAFLIAALTSLKVTRPVRELIRRTERVAAGDWSAASALERPGTLELKQLSESFTEMAKKLEHRADYIRSFAAGVSHEFKTPLTSIKGTLELLKEHFEDMSAGERERFLDNLEGDADRLQRLVDRLLELARADVSERSQEQCSLKEVLGDIQHEQQAAGHALQLDAVGESVTVAMRGATLHAVLSNLVENAFHHGGQVVRISVGEGTDASGSIEVSVIDDGPGVSAANADRIFDPFFTTARETGGTGLGLSIVASLMRAHGGSVGYSRDGEQTVLRLNLPA